VLLILGTNKQPSEPKLTNTHNGNLHGLLPVVHQSDQRPAPVRPVTPARPVDRAGQAGGYSSRTTNVPQSLNDFCRPWNKNTPQPARKKKPSQSLAKQLQTNQELTSNSTTQRHTGQASHSRQNPQKGSDRSLAPVRPVKPGQLGMNSTCRSTPPNPTTDLPIRFTDPNKTLGIVGTPHGHSIAKLWSTKTH
jgi:hypothetical protein